MGIRDRLSARWFMPLVAGVDSARRGGPLPPSIFTPGLDPGNPGDGDGGEGTPDDPTINQPSITSPASGATDVEPDATATSSAFGSTNGQTHIRSRWVIELRSSASGGASAMIVWDSGPTNDDLTSISMEPADLGRETTYAIKVRHKGSNGGWSPWSAYSVFTTAPCPEFSTCTQYATSHDGSSPAGSGLGWFNSMAEACAAQFEYAKTQTSPLTGYVMYGTAPSCTYCISGYGGDGCGEGTSIPMTTKVYTTRTGPYCPGPCVELPPEPPPTPEDPEPPIVPPPPPPPVPPPSEPPATGGFAGVVLDLRRSLVIGGTTAESYTFQQAISTNGVTFNSGVVLLELVFTNAQAVRNSANWAVSCTNPAVTIDPAGVQSVSVPANGEVTRSVVVTYALAGAVPATIILKVDTGTGDALSLPVGLTGGFPVT